MLQHTFAPHRVARIVYKKQMVVKGQYIQKTGGVSTVCSYHAIADSHMRLDKGRTVRIRFQFFSQGGHKYPQGGHIVLPGGSPDLLGNIVMCQHLSAVAGQQAQEFVFDRCQVQFFVIQVCAAAA